MKRDFSILVVEDEAILRKTMKKILAEEGFDVFVAEDGKQAVSLASSRDIDVLLVDVTLPDINGVEVLKQIKEFKPNVEAVMMTAYVVEDLINVAFKKGAYACLHKPFEIKTLFKILNDLRNKNE